MIDYDETIERIFAEIKAHGYKSRAKFAEKHDFDTNMFYRWKYGKHRPSLDKVVRIADALGVKVDDLIVRAKE